MQLECNENVFRVVFSGPSLSREALGVLPSDTRILPPIQRGDLDQAVQTFPNLKAIGIVDGKFFQSFAISPKEVLRSMDRGKRLFGSSGMGALRATELALYGMAGIGTIYQMFVSGEIDADDEVAITYDPDSLRPTSEPLANIRIALGRACEAGKLDKSVMEIAIRAVKDLHYPDRTYDGMLARVRHQLSAIEFSQLKVACQSPPDAKCEDAFKLLAAMGILDADDRSENSVNQRSTSNPLQLAVQQRTANRSHWPEMSTAVSPPALRKELPAGYVTRLPQPQAVLPDSLSDLLDRRRSVRSYFERPLRLEELSTLLHHSARIIRVAEDPNTGQVALRPFANAGARSELEIYVVSEDIAGLEAGAFYYDPYDHGLMKLRDRGEQQVRFLHSVHEMTGAVINRPPAATLLITAVFERVMWKYGDLGPSLIYKDVGCLFQTLYLVATALGLAPCAIGGGDEAQNSRWLGLDPRLESQVGCFLIGPRADD